MILVHFNSKTQRIYILKIQVTKHRYFFLIVLTLQNHINNIKNNICKQEALGPHHSPEKLLQSIKKFSQSYDDNITSIKSLTHFHKKLMVI